METVDWARQWAEQLGDIADHVMKQIPESEEWNAPRHFLKNINRLLKQGDMRAGMRVTMRVLPYIQRAISSIEKYHNVHDTYGITESIARHFLVEDSAKETIESQMQIAKIQLDTLGKDIQDLSRCLDLLLDDTFLEGKGVSLFATLKLAFRINRITASIRSCEDLLNHIRDLLDALDTHVAGKSFLAKLTSLICLLFGIGQIFFYSLFNMTT